uniref:Uncharacterized protein n=1 Tax=Nelumbo nucifera TaxID=4432 RepID=A0A822Y1X2_NELNU|nr:TPA_asm: hypothetical protein HUJ06_026763 [Nelumbo nucifera]
MGFQRTGVVLIIALVLVAIFSHGGVEAARALSEDFASANHLVTYPSVYERARFSMAFWLERLASGPSPKGPGH